MFWVYIKCKIWYNFEKKTVLNSLKVNMSLISERQPGHKEERIALSFDKLLGTCNCIKAQNISPTSPSLVDDDDDWTL